MRLVLASLAALGLATAAQSATVLFQDDFDAEGTPGTSTLNYTGFAKWTVTSGNVDLVNQTNPFGITACPGKCVDLAGTPGPGTIVSAPIAFLAGARVDVFFDVSGNQRTGATDSFTLAVAFAPPNSGIADGVAGPPSFVFPGWLDALNGTPYVESIVGTRGFLTYHGWFIPDFAGTFTLGFTGAGGGNANIGPILDNVRVTQGVIPEPAIWAMLIAGFGMVGVAARRRQTGVTA